MKAFFSDNCYWDDKTKSVFRDNGKIIITPSQCKLLAKLIKCNGQMVSHEELYYEMTNYKPTGDYKTSLSNQFTRNKINEKGLLIRVPEINAYFESSKSIVGGGYMLKLPKQNCIDENKEVCSQKSLIETIWYTNENIEVWRRQGNSNDSYRIKKLMKTYLQGGQCTWPILFTTNNNGPVRRDILDDIKKYIENENGAIALLGAGGEGKSTVLMQIFVEFYADNKQVFFHAPTFKFDFPNLLDGDSKYFIIDNPPNSKDFKQFLSNAISMGHMVIVGARSNEWNILKDNLFDDVKRSIKEIEIPRLSLKESKNFAHCTKINISEIERSEKELLDMFYKDSYGFLYASMLMATYNCASLEDIAYQMIEKVSQYEKSFMCLKVLAAIVFGEKNGMTISSKCYKNLCKGFSVDERDPKYYLKKEICLNGAIYQTRHKKISELFYKYLFTEGNWKNYLSSDEIENVICNLVDSNLVDVGCLNKDLNPKDLRVINISNLLIAALEYTQNDEYINYVFQRLMESCQKHCHPIIERVFHGITEKEIKEKIVDCCLEKKLPIWEIYRKWIAVQQENSEKAEYCEEILIEVCGWNDAPVRLWLMWGGIEEKLSNIGDSTKRNSAFWIYNKACEQNKDSGDVWILYIDFLKRYPEKQNVNSSIEEIYRNACLKYKCRNEIWTEWANFEEELGNIGDYNTIGTAAWIHKESCEKDLNIANGSGWINWSRFILRNYNELKDYSASDILKNACLNLGAGTSVWNEWFKEEKRIGNVGNYTKEHTAAWIIMEACKNYNKTGDPVLWKDWLYFTDEYPEIENSYSKLEILRLACSVFSIKYSLLWVLWAKEEEKINNLGNYDEKGSALWIYKEGAEREMDRNGQIWIEWARFVKNHEMDSCKNDLNTPSSIFRNACLVHDLGPRIWRIWAEYEEEINNIGNYESEYTVAWIFKEGYTNHNSSGDTELVLRWAKFADQYPMYDVNRNYIDANYVLDMAHIKYPGFKNQTKSSLNDYKQEIDI